METLLTQTYQRTIEKVIKDNIICTDMLSARELYIVTLITKGNAPKEIADYLNLSEDTIHTHIKNIYEKLDVHKQTELVSWFLTQFFNPSKQ